MAHKFLRSFLIAVLTGLLVLSATACGFDQALNSSKPTVAVNILQAESGNLSVGQDITIQVVAADATGINRIDILVDGQLLNTVPVNPPSTSFITTQTWRPDLQGSHVIQAIAYSVTNAASDPTQLIVQVAGAGQAGAVMTPTPAPAESGEASTGDSLAVEPTATPAPAQPDWAAVTALVNLNVRQGPGLDYPVIGQLQTGQTAQITGKSQDGSWWQIVYPPNSDQRAWVSANSQYSTSQNTENVPVAAAPAPPQPAATPTPIPTATSQPAIGVTPPVAQQKPVIYHFTADRYTISAGESVTLSWDLANAREAYLVYDGNFEGVVAPGSKVVNPAASTVYTLVARNEAGDTIVSLNITVNGAPVPDITPIIPLPLLTPIHVYPIETPTPELIVPLPLLTPVQVYPIATPTPELIVPLPLLTPVQVYPIATPTP